MKTFAIYSRKSKFTGKGDSIENQIEMCKNYISTKFPDEQYTLTIFEDEGYSGKSLKRPQFQAMMDAERVNPFDFIVVYRLDRISRNVGDFASLIEKLNEYGTSFICIKEQFDTSTPMGRAMMNIAAVFAQLERETIAERVKDNMYMLAKEGRWTGGTTPLGYKSEKHTFDSGGKSRSYYTLTIDDNQLDLVRLIFDKYSELQSINGVEVYLREHHHLTQKGNKWDKSNLKRVLSNPIYAIADEDSYNYFVDLGCNVCFSPDECNGEFGILPYNRFAGGKRALTTPDKWLITMSTHKGIMSGKEWVRIQNILKSNSKKCFGGKPQTRRVVNSKSLLSGLLFCSCGAYMRPKIYGSGNMFYICEEKMKSKKEKCSNDNINGDELDNLVLNEVFNYDVDGNSINQQLSNLRKQINNVGSEIDNHLDRLMSQKKENEKAIQNLIVALSMNVSPDTVSAINKQIETLSQANVDIDLQMNELANKDAVKYDMTNNLNTIQEVLVYIKNNFSKLSIENRREYIKQIVDKIVWDGKEVHIFIRGSI